MKKILFSLLICLFSVGFSVCIVSCDNEETNEYMDKITGKWLYAKTQNTGWYTITDSISCDFRANGTANIAFSSDTLDNIIGGTHTIWWKLKDIKYTADRYNIQLFDKDGLLIDDYNITYKYIVGGIMATINGKEYVFLKDDRPY